MKTTKVVLIFLLGLLLLSACAPQAELTATAQPSTPAITPTALQPAALAAIQALAEELGIQADQVSLVSIEPREWPDACLGVPRPEELCAAAITPGYEVTLEANGETYVYHTNTGGDSLRLAPELPPAEIEGPLHAARLALSAKLGLAPDEFELVSFEAVDWPDACLGVVQSGEVCAAVITPGYKIELSAEGKTYVAHTDRTGGEARIASGVEGLEGTAAEDAARRALAEHLSVAAGTIQVISSTQETWPDGCLGLAKPEELCVAVMTPGYAVTLQAGGATYRVRTNLDGGVARVELADQPGASGAAIAWKLEGETCQSLSIGEGSAVSFGPCHGDLADGQLSDVNPDRVAELAALLSAYAPFKAQTPAGEVEFNGTGEQTATPAEQRSVAEWMRLVARELTSRKTDPEQGKLLTWHREGGIAGFCDDLIVSVDGFARSSSCKGATPEAMPRTRLSAAQLETLYGWMAEYQPFKFEHTDPATADAMTVRLSFLGAGRQAASNDEQQQIVLFAQEVWNAK